MIKFTHIKEDNIIYVERHGEIVLEDIIKYVEDIDQFALDLEHIFILDDMRNSTTKFTIVDNPIIIDEIKKRISKYVEVRCAVLVDKPFDTALSILYENLARSVDNYSYKTFSTKDAGKKWLMQSDYYKVDK